VVEMPYEFVSEESRERVDYERFSHELLAAGCSQSQVIGTWEHSQGKRLIKERILYLCKA